MKKLSPYYRNDDIAEVDSDMRLYLDTEYLPTLENLDEENPKILVVFSGGSAIGKSSLSRRIAQDLHGVMIENDAIKRAIIRKLPNIERKNELNKLVWNYSIDLYNRLPNLTLNGLIIRDGVIDWYYDRILPVFEKKGYKIFVVQYEISEEKARELIVARGDTPTVSAEFLLKQLEDHFIHQKRFRSEYKADVVLDETHVFDHDIVIEKLKSTISLLHSNSS